MGIYKLSAKKEEDGTITKLKSGIIEIKLPKEIGVIVRRMRKLSNKKYIFGGDKVLS